MSLQLHPTKGVNPRLGYCPRCGKENGEILLIGKQDRKAKCGGCDVTLYGFTGFRPRQECPKCGADQWYAVEEIGDAEKLPSALCDECKKETAEHAAVVAAGGVYFRCTACGASGAIRPTAELTKAVREKAGLAQPDAAGRYAPVGAEFTAEDCPVCGPDPVGG